MRRGGRVSALLGVIVCALGVMAARSPVAAWALPPSYEPPQAERHRVLVIPDFPVYPHIEPSGADLKGGAGGGGEVAVPRASEVRRVVEGYLGGHPYFVLVDAGAVLGGLLQERGVAEGLLGADRARREGIQAFYRFEFEAGIAQLEQALRLYEGSYGSLLAAERVAEAHQLLAFSKLELLILGMVAPGREARVSAEVDAHLEEMARLDPGREVDERKHTAEQVNRHSQARWRLMRDVAALGVDDVERARWITQRAQGEVAFVVTGRVIQQADGQWTLSLRVMSGRSDLVVFDELIPLPPSPGVWRERVDAAVSRFASYTPAPPPLAPPPGEEGRLYLDLAFSYLQYLERPTHEPFHNMGANFAATYMATQHFSFVGKVAFALSGRDVRGDLLTTFNTVRGFLGVGLSFEVEAIATRFFMHSGFEVMAASDFSATRDIDCKVYGTLDPECPASAVQRFSLDPLGGLGGAMGVNVGADPAYVVVQVSSAFYWFPFNSVTSLNYPLSFEVGAQYRFF